MTFENTPVENTPASSDTGSAHVASQAAPSKPARRRATRRTAAPSDPSAAEVVVGSAAEVPAAKAAVEVPSATAIVTDQGATGAPRRSRRVTRTVGTPSAVDAPATASVPAAHVEVEQLEVLPADTAPVETASVETAPAETAPVEDASVEDAPARAPRSRRATAPRGAARRAAAEAPSETVVAPEPIVASEPAPVVEASEPEPARKRPTRRSRTSAAPVVEAQVDEDEVAETVPVPATKAAAAPQLDVLAELAATVPPSSATRSTAPRMATTALLFQAPDPESRPRRRRVVSAAGSPEAISEAAAALRSDENVEPESDSDVVAPSAVVETVEETQPERTSRRRGRRGAARVEEVVEPEVVIDPWEVDALPAPVEDAETDEDEDEETEDGQSVPRRRRRRGGRGRRSRVVGDSDEQGESFDEPTDEGSAADEDESDESDSESDADQGGDTDEQGGSSRRRRRRRRSGRGTDSADVEAATPTRTRTPRAPSDEVTALRGSTRLEAKRQRRREGRDAGRRRQIITESEFLARRESVERSMVVRELGGRTQIAVLEDGVLVEHYVSRQAQASMAGNVYLGRVQNVLPSMEAAFIDVGKGRNAVLYAGEVNWDAAGLDGQPRRIEQALKSGDSVLVQVTKDPMGHKGARLTSQVTLAGRYLVYVPGGGMTGISRKLPDVERNRLKKLLREIVPSSAGVIVRTAAEGASEDELRADIARLQGQWEAIEKKAKSASAPALLQGEPDLAIRVVRDVFNDDFTSLVVQGDDAWATISGYVGDLAPDLAERVSRWTGEGDVFASHRVDEQLAKGMDRKVWLPSGGSLVIDRTEAMTVVDVNTGKFTGTGGTLEETVTRNNLEAAEEIVRQLRLRDIGGIIVIDFIDMVLESNRDLVLRRLVECLGRDRTKHQVAEVTSLGLVQMTRKRVGQGLVEAFSETCEHCNGRGFIVHTEPVDRFGHPDAELPMSAPASVVEVEPKRARRKRGAKETTATGPVVSIPVLPEARAAVKATLATIAAAAAHAHDHVHDHESEPARAAVPVPLHDLFSTEDVRADVETTVADASVEVPVQVWADDVTEVPAAPQDEQLELTPVDPGVFEVDDDEDGPTV